MKKLLIVCLFLMSQPLFASHIQCFSKGKLIYSGNPKDVYAKENFLLIERKNKVDIIYNSDCIITFYFKNKKAISRL